jgi:3-hydroxymyristoyl/3-hydroxydecanoyl-(acyl carrier protein) dehydratase
MSFLFVDRILTLTPEGAARGVKQVTPDDYYVCLDTLKKRYFVPALVGETVGQLAAWHVMQRCDFTKRPVAGIVERACLHRPVYVGETIQLATQIKSLDESTVHYSGEARVRDELVFELIGALGPLLPMDDFVDEKVVRAQFDELNRPGDWPEEAALRTPLDESNVTLDSRVSTLVQFDRVLEHEVGVRVVAEKCLTRAAPYFPDHFPKKPVMPMTILLECLMNLGRDFTAQAFPDKPYRVQEMRRIKMNDFLLPSDVVTATLSIKSHHDDLLVLACRVSRFDKRVCLLELVMTPEARVL